MEEDKKAFPYKPPSKEILKRYSEIFKITEPIKERPVKFFFDRIFAFIILILLFPVFLVIFVFYLIDGLIFREDRGSFFSSYIASTQGRKFNKLKFRIIREEFIDKELKAKGDWHAYSSEWGGKNLTRMGRVLKQYYLDELPQIINIFKGEMSFIGPRALAWHHYQRDLMQGNIGRKLLKAGIFSESHTRKGTKLFGRPELEYDYIEKYLKYSAPRLLWVDITIIARGIKMILKGEGY